MADILSTLDIDITNFYNDNKQHSISLIFEEGINTFKKSAENLWVGYKDILINILQETRISPSNILVERDKEVFNYFAIINTYPHYTIIMSIYRNCLDMLYMKYKIDNISTRIKIHDYIALNKLNGTDILKDNENNYNKYEVLGIFSAEEIRSLDYAIKYNEDYRLKRELVVEKFYNAYILYKDTDETSDTVQLDIII